MARRTGRFSQLVGARDSAYRSASMIGRQILNHVSDPATSTLNPKRNSAMLPTV
jgi:hypothetical protein